MNNYETIRVERNGAVAHLQLNRPERINALGKAMLSEIQHAMDALEADGEIRAIVLSGAGRGFSSGFDLKEQMARRPEGATVWREILELDFSTTMRFWDCPKPTIAAIHGACMAGAFEMALACDPRSAREMRSSASRSSSSAPASSRCSFRGWWAPRRPRTSC